MPVMITVRFSKCTVSVPSSPPRRTARIREAAVRDSRRLPCRPYEIVELAPGAFHLARVTCRRTEQRRVACDGAGAGRTGRPASTGPRVRGGGSDALRHALPRPALERADLHVRVAAFGPRRTSGAPAASRPGASWRWRRLPAVGFARRPRHLPRQPLRRRRQDGIAPGQGRGRIHARSRCAGRLALARGHRPVPARRVPPPRYPPRQSSCVPGDAFVMGGPESVALPRRRAYPARVRDRRRWGCAAGSA